MKKYLWDTGALALVFSKHKVATQYYKKTLDNEIIGYVPQLVLAEFYYKTWQKFGRQAAFIRTKALQSEVLQVISYSEEEIYNVGELKVKYPKLSIVDAVLITLAKRYHTTILTTDEPIKRSKEVRAIKLDY